MKLFKPSVLFLLFFVLSFSMFMPIPQVDAQLAPDTGGLGECSGLGDDYDRPDPADINPAVSNASSYTFTVISRSKIFVQASASGTNESFFATGAEPTLGQIFGNGCTLTDSHLDDNFTYVAGAVSIVAPESFRDQSKQDNNRNLGTINPSGNLAMSINFIYDGSPLNMSPITLSVPLASVQNTDMFNHIFQISGTDQQLTLTGTATEDVDIFKGPGPLYSDTSDTGSDCIRFPSGGSATALLAAGGQPGEADDWYDMQYDRDCDGSPIPIKVRGGAAPTSAEMAGLPTDVLEDAGAIGSTSCEELMDFALNFILCPLLILGDNMIGWLDDKIISLLRVEETYYNNPQIKNAWGNIRNIAYIVLIPIMLVMVIGTALGFGFVDAYTVRRTVPRLFVAAIFMALSYDIARIMIEITNGIGQGIAGLIASPFGGLDNMTLRHIFDPGVGSALVVAGIGAAVILPFILSKGLRSSGAEAADNALSNNFGFATVAITVGLVALALLAVFLLLAFREMMLIFLLVISPLAILAWIFPNNDKPWKLWWGSFTKLLYLFPIIAGLMAIGRSFAMLVNIAGNSDPVLGTLLKLVAVIGPYFFIPKLFQMAGGAFANIAGMVNNREKGLFDRMRKRRDEARKGYAAQHHEGQRWKGNGALSRRLNASGHRSHARSLVRQEQGFMASLNEDRVKAAERALLSERRQKGGQDARITEILANDSAGAAGRIMAEMSEHGASEADIVRAIGDQLERDGIDRSGANGIYNDLLYVQGRMGNEVLKHMAVIGEAGSKTSFKNGPAEMLAAIAEAADGDESIAAALYSAARSKAEAAQRMDLAGYSWADGFEQMQQIMGAANATQRDTVMQDANKFLLQKSRRGKSSGQIWSSHRTSVENHAQSLKVEYDEATAELADSHENYTTWTKRFNDANAAGDAVGAQLAKNMMNDAQRRLSSAESVKMKILAEISNANDQVAYFAPEMVDTFNQIVYQAPASTVGLKGEISTEIAVGQDSHGMPITRHKTIQDEVDQARDSGNLDFRAETRALSQREIEMRDRMRGGMGPPGAI